MRLRFIAFSLVDLPATAAQADTIGRTTVIDGDTIEIRGETDRRWECGND